MKRWNPPIAVYLFLVFVSGGVVGALAYRMYSPPSARSDQRPNPDAWRRQYLQEMQTRVKLTPSQVQEMNVIMDATDANFTQIHEKHHQEIETIKEEHRAKVRAILTAEQLPKYEQLRVERDARQKAAKK